MALRASSLMAGSVHVATVGPDGARSCRRAHGRQGRCAPPQAVARRRAILDRRCARRLELAQVGTEGWSPVEQKDADFPLPLPTCCIDFGKRKRLLGLGVPHQFQK